MTQKDNGPGPGRNYGETAVFTFGRKVVFGLKMGFKPKNHPPKMIFWVIIIWAKVTFAIYFALKHIRLLTYTGITRLQCGESPGLNASLVNLRQHRKVNPLAVSL